MQNMRQAPFKLKLQTIDEVSYNDICQQQKQLEDLQEQEAQKQRQQQQHMAKEKERLTSDLKNTQRSTVIKIAPPAPPAVATGVDYVTNLITSSNSHKKQLKSVLADGSVQKPLYQCDTCYKQFAQRHYLAIHRRTHTGEKPFECKICLQRFARRDTLQVHYRTHTGEKPFHCDLCPKRFAQRDKLQIHRRVHTGEKPYSCHVCEKRFSQRNALLVHLRCHSGEKPFACEVCSKQFSTCDKLRKHSLTHTHEKPFQCNTCMQRFARRDTREHHQKTHIQQATVTATSREITAEVSLSASRSDTKTEPQRTASDLSKEVTTDLPNVNKYLMLL